MKNVLLPRGLKLSECLSKFVQSNPLQTISLCALKYAKEFDWANGISLAVRAPVPQWIKRWPSDRAIELKPRSRRNLLYRKRGSIAHSLSLSCAHRPDMTEILLKRT